MAGDKYYEYYQSSSPPPTRGRQPPLNPDNAYRETTTTTTKKTTLPPPNHPHLLPRPRSRSLSKSTRALIRAPSPPSSSSSSSSSSSPTRKAYYNNNSSNHYYYRSPSPLSRARYSLDQTFTSSTAGLSAGIIGALAGGLAAHHLSSSTSSSHNQSNNNNNYNKNSTNSSGGAVATSTILGAAIGGLGANALANRWEDRGGRRGWEERHGVDVDRFRHPVRRAVEDRTGGYSYDGVVERRGGGGDRGFYYGDYDNDRRRVYSGEYYRGDARSRYDD